MSNTGDGNEHLLLVDVGPVNGITVIVQTTVRKRPQRFGLLLEFILNPFTFAIAQKGAESTRVQVVQDGDQEAIVEFERVGELLRDLPDAVDELQEDGGTIRVRMMIVAVSYSLQ